MRRNAPLNEGSGIHWIASTNIEIGVDKMVDGGGTRFRSLNLMNNGRVAPRRASIDAHSGPITDIDISIGARYNRFNTIQILI